eukprot:382081-Hanusia_phi.AAC.2
MPSSSRNRSDKPGESDGVNITIKDVLQSILEICTQSVPLDRTSKSNTFDCYTFHLENTVLSLLRLQAASEKGSDGTEDPTVDHSGPNRSEDQEEES